MTIEEARRSMRLIVDTERFGDTGQKARLEIIATLLVQTYELGWAHGRLAREAADEAAERAKCGSCKMKVKP